MSLILTRPAAPTPDGDLAPAAELRPPTGARLRLRALDPGDVDELYAMFSDPRATRYWPAPAFASHDDVSIYLEALERDIAGGDRCQWGIVPASGGPIVGSCGLERVDANHGRAELTLMVARPFWGRRYGREALGLVLDHAFNELGLHRVEAELDPRNQPGLETLEAFGFRREGYLRQRWRLHGEAADSLLLGLLDSEHFGRA